MKKIKITVLRKTCHRDLMEQYENPIEHACDLYEGQVFTTDGWRKPDGLCDSAWQTLSPFVMTLAHGGTNIYDGWMKNPASAMISCNDGFRPVSFLVEALDEDFQLAILGSKGKWYDHTVRVANAQPAAAEAPADGTYTCDVTIEGGSGRATVDSPAALTVADGRMTATIVWSSPNYDYMLVDGEKYLPTNTEGNSTFEIPVTALDTPLDVVGDTVAMSTPHEIEYTLTFASASLIEAK